MRDPMPYLAKYPDADVLTSSDHLAPTATDGGLEHHQRAASPANIGIMLIRHTAKELTTQWVEVLKREDYWCAPLPHTRHCGAKTVANRAGRDFGCEMAHAAVSQRPPISLSIIAARTEG
jgi:hypothetical protein